MTSDRLADVAVRLVSLGLAIWSHGPAVGADSDRCFPARAEHFARYLRTGANPRPADPGDPR